ncbi:MAG: fumarate hydratase, partial [Spirochaetales bacterium]|nr:fumarate hydratase [Spirochaetales bacterium]
MKLSKSIENALSSAVRILPDDVEKAIKRADSIETGSLGKVVLDNILKNIEVSKETLLPLCQDTGMFWVLVSVGKKAKFNMSLLENEINQGCKAAAKNAYFRKSVVKDPLFDRTNTANNLPIVINYELVEG